jgi:DNA polymerase-3 subunit beta
MKLTVRQENLLQGLQDVVSVVPSKSTLPILANVLIEVEEGSMKLTATDLDISIRAVISSDIKVSSGGRFCVSARKLSELVRELGPADVTLTLMETKLHVESGGTYKLVTADAGDFPEIPKLQGATSLEIPAGKLETLIRRSIYAVATDETRPELTGVYTEVFPKQIVMVATNGHRMARAALSGDFHQETNFLIPTKALQQVLRIMDDPDQTVRINGAKGYAAFEVGSRTLMTRLLEGPFPRYEQVIPKDNPHKVLVPLSPFRAALRRALVLADPVTRPVKFSASSGMLKIIVETQNVGESEEEVEVNYDGEEMRIGFNGGYILDFLKTFQCERVQMAFQSSTTAGVFTPDDGNPEEPVLCLVMPLRLADEEPQTRRE